MGKTTLLFKELRQALNVIPKEYASELKEELIHTNIKRLVILSISLIIMTAITIISDLAINLSNGMMISGYEKLFYSKIAFIIERSIYAFMIYRLNNKKGNLYTLKKGLLLYGCIIGIGWCLNLSMHTQLISMQTCTFIVGSLYIASSLLLLPAEGLFIYLVNFASFIIMLAKSNQDMSYLAQNAISMSFVAFFTFLMTYFNITQFTKNYLNQKTIKMQAHELECAANKLEETVRTRTDELVKANEQLIREMGIRHEIEMQSIKTKLLYEENTMRLEEIKEYEELRNVFFANLSHELRTPLNVIFSAQQMMDSIIKKQDCQDCSNKLTKYNKIVKQNCYRLIRLIGNLIDITKIDAEYFEINKKNCDIIKVIENITQSVAEYIKDKNIELSFDTEVNERIVACDPDKIERIILNLLSNAVKFTPENGWIRVHVKLVHGYVGISVKDNGIGISREMQQVVFERFIQADKSITRNREGSGIGLSLVKSLVDLHQGRISLISEPGKGSEFIVEIPDVSIPYEDCIACTNDDEVQNIERISIEFSDIYS